MNIRESRYFRRLQRVRALQEGRQERAAIHRNRKKYTRKTKYETQTNTEGS